MKNLLDKQWVRYILILLVGIGVGAIFYPSKTITKEEEITLKQKIERLETEKKNITSFFEKRLEMEIYQGKKYHEQVTKEIDSLKEENTTLKQKVSEKKFKIVRPDGTIEEQWFKDSESEVVTSTVTKIKSEFNRKVESIENKWKNMHEERVKKVKEDYEKKIAELREHEATKTTKEKIEINKHNFGVSLGYTTEQNYFSSVTYDIYGPFFLDVHLESDKQFGDKEIGFGVGLRF